MERHASESYDVAGEGLLTVSAGGRDRPTGAAAKAAAPFQFSRMGPDGKDHQLDPETVKALAANMAAGGGTSVEESLVPAGYTYLGQFVAHDLSFDKTIVTLGTNISPTRLLQGTSPCLDLDSLYGAGPQDPESAGFYEDDGLHLKMGGTIPGVGGVADDGFDLPRGTPADRRRAVIADPRNDDNLAVAQTHLAFIRFHNRVVDTLPAHVPESLRFPRARACVTKHYQWMVWHDFLPRICAKRVLDDVMANHRKAFEPDAEPTAAPTMPIEFSIGTFRLGHSMVRGFYSWNRVKGTATLNQLFTFAAKGGDLGGEDRLPTRMIADFRRLYDFREAGRTDLAASHGELNRALRIDTRLAEGLQHLPSGTFGEEEIPPHDRARNLAFRNLERARMVNLASGPQMAGFLIECGVPLTKLEPEQLLDDATGTRLTGFLPGHKEELAERAPLWFYVLREAERNGGRLDGVGARIVAETFHRAIEGSDASIVRDADWHPTLGSDPTKFRMVELLLFAFEGSKRLLAPLEPDTPSPV
jgi:heme peroxidase